MDNRKYIRTDLAAESAAKELESEGITYDERGNSDVKIAEMRVKDEEGSKASGRPVGTYITISFERPWLVSDDVFEKIVSSVSNELFTLIKSVCSKTPSSVLIAGLGNRYVTADAVGPLSIRDVIITRHIKTNDAEIFEKLGQLDVSAIAPGVVGQTGIETFELILGAAEKTRPDVVVVIDALAARSTDRLATTIQLTDTGIAPGSGIGNRRRAINSETLGMPVIAIGVPTIVDSATLVYDALEKAGITDIDDSLVKVLENGRSFFVSPKDCDSAVNELSRAISEALNQTFACDRWE